MNPELYLPFHAARKHGVLDPGLVEPVPLRAGVDLAQSGVLPNKAGLVRVGQELGAIDLVDVVHLSDNEIAVQPTEKERVDAESCAITQPGHLIFSMPGSLKLFAEAVPGERIHKRRKLHEHHRAQVTAHRQNMAGLHVIRYAFGTHYRDIRVEDDGTVIARS